MIKIGPAGIGSVKDVEKNFEEFHRLGIKCAEIPFTYGVFIKTKEQAEKVHRAAEKFKIELTIHGQYWINLNSAEREKIEASKQRILECLKVGTWLDAKAVVFHSGFYGKKTKGKTFEKIKEGIRELQEKRKEFGYTPKLAPETMGKINVFGSISEIARLVEETGCEFCIDFAHILARYKTYNFEKIKEKFGKYPSWHCHFSGIEYGEKGEKKHLRTEERYWEKLFERLPKDKKIRIVCESPNPLADAVQGIEILKNK